MERDFVTAARKCLAVETRRLYKRRFFDFFTRLGSGKRLRRDIDGLRAKESWLTFGKRDLESVSEVLAKIGIGGLLSFLPFSFLLSLFDS